MRRGSGRSLGTANQPKKRLALILDLAPVHRLIASGQRHRNRDRVLVNVQSDVCATLSSYEESVVAAALTETHMTLIRPPRAGRRGSHRDASWMSYGILPSAATYRHDTVQPGIRFPRQSDVKSSAGLNIAAIAAIPDPLRYPCGAVLPYGATMPRGASKRVGTMTWQRGKVEATADHSLMTTTPTLICRIIPARVKTPLSLVPLRPPREVSACRKRTQPTTISVIFPAVRHRSTIQ